MAAVNQPASSRPAPVFIVGSLRSGASLLSLALGQHPGLTAVMANPWLEPFAIGLQRSYEAAVRVRNTSQLDIGGVELDDFFAQFGPVVHQLMLGVGDSETARSATRLIDATPVNAFIITPLRLLFPDAKFIHVVRNARDVAGSLADPNLRRVYKSAYIRASEKQGYDHWQRSVSACLAAEHAYGSGVVLRVRRADLIATPEATIQRCLEFLGESFDEACVRPFSSIPPEIATLRTNLIVPSEGRPDLATRTNADLLSAVLMEQGNRFSAADIDASWELRTAMWTCWTQGGSLIPHLPGELPRTPKKSAGPMAAKAVLPPPPQVRRFTRLLRRKQ